MYSNADTEWSEATGHFSGIHQEFQWLTLLPAYKLSLMSPITNSMAYIIVLIYIRSPSCMAISRSCIWSRLLTFVEKKDSYPLSSFCIFFLLKKMQMRYPPTIHPVTTGYHRLPRVTISLYGYMIFWIFVLSLLTAHFIKSSDGDLQCEWNSDIFSLPLCVDDFDIRRLVIPYFLQ